MRNGSRGIFTTPVTGNTKTMNRRVPTTRKDRHDIAVETISSSPISSSAAKQKKVLKRRRRVKSSKANKRVPATEVMVSLVLLYTGFSLGKYMVAYLTGNAEPPKNPLRRIQSLRVPSSRNHPNTIEKQSQPKDPTSWIPPYPKITRGNSSTTLSTQALEMCTNTLWHTLETTTIVLPNEETFVHTGDIDDLWLRDSAAQIHTLLIPVMGEDRSALIAKDPQLDRIVAGLIKRTAMYIRHDPYANAFRIDDSYVFSSQQKKLGRHDLISTWNYELDSACYYIRMLYFYWKQSPTSSKESSVLRLPQVQEAVDIMVDLWKAEQKHELDEYPKGPLFDCVNCNKPYRYPELKIRNGKGSPTNATSGLTWTGFRPSDDECRHHFLVPANMFAVVALEYVEELATDLWKNQPLATKAGKLAKEIQRGIEEHAIVNHSTHGKIYAYEVDGLGRFLVMDDANVPNLLSIPYLGYKHYDPEIYANTRRFIFSKDNPTYYSGNNALTGNIEGYGSPHMGVRIKKNIWPMALAMKGLTSDSVEEKIELVEQLVKASAHTGWMHESFDVNNPDSFTRSWFCWADSLFAELVLSITDQCPNPSHKYRVMEWRDPNYIEGGNFADN